MLWVEYDLGLTSERPSQRPSRLKSQRLTERRSPSAETHVKVLPLRRKRGGRAH
jgi:hypothetical protein